MRYRALDYTSAEVAFWLRRSMIDDAAIVDRQQNQPRISAGLY
jgi:hypothetical protein